MDLASSNGAQVKKMNCVTTIPNDYRLKAGGFKNGVYMYWVTISVFRKELEKRFHVIIWVVSRNFYERKGWDLKIF